MVVDKVKTFLKKPVIGLNSDKLGVIFTDRIGKKGANNLKILSVPTKSKTIIKCSKRNRD